MAKIRKAITAAFAGLAAYLVSALTTSHQHLSASLVSAAVVAALVAGLAVFAVPNAPAGPVGVRRAP